MIRRPIFIRTLAAFTLAAVGAASLTACGASGPFGRDARIRSNLTPELATLDQTHVDTRNSYALMSNENLRMLNDDLLKFFYLDRPSRLTSLPMPH